MTDEEIFNAWKSEQYKDQSTEEKMEFVEHLHSFPRYFKKAFLDGLKAGKETEREYVKNNAFTSMKEQGLFPFGKWHKVADGDLPKVGQKCYFIYSNLYGEGNKVIFSESSIEVLTGVYTFILDEETGDETTETCFYDDINDKEIYEQEVYAWKEIVLVDF